MPPADKNEQSDYQFVCFRMEWLFLKRIWSCFKRTTLLDFNHLFLNPLNPSSTFFLSKLTLLLIPNRTPHHITTQTLYQLTSPREKLTTGNLLPVPSRFFSSFYQSAMLAPETVHFGRSCPHQYANTRCAFFFEFREFC